jgi:hypothetical protein
MTVVLDQPGQVALAGNADMDPSGHAGERSPRVVVPPGASGGQKCIEHTLDKSVRHQGNAQAPRPHPRGERGWRRCWFHEVIQLAGTSMLAEANQLAQPVLSMVRGNDRDGSSRP